jgi:hypothetical protein
MLNIRFKLTYLFFFICLAINAQDAILADSIAKKLDIKIVLLKTFLEESKIPSMTYSEFYDTNGKLKCRTSFNNNFNLIEIKEYFIYNLSGQLIKKQDVSFSRNDSSVSTQTYSYNNKGQLDKNSHGKIEYRYNGQGQVISRIEKNDKSIDSTIYSYDSLGYLLSKENNWSYLKEKITWEYNNNQQLINEIRWYFFSPVEIYQYKNSFFYNEKGLITHSYQVQTITPEGEVLEPNRRYIYEYLYY